MQDLGETDNPLPRAPGGDPDGQSHMDHERSTLLGSERIPLPEEEDEDHARQVSSWKRLPWWKRPSPYWLIFGAPIASIGYSALLAPKVALYTTLACRVHRPEYIANNPYLHSSLPLINNLTITDGNELAVDTVSVLLPNSTYIVSPDYIQNDPDIEQKCSSDPVVQAAVATLSAVLTTSMGILCCLTTGWWSSLSDRSGRRIVIFTSLFGLFMTDVTHLITARFVDVLPGGYWFPVVGSIIEGLCGGTSTGMAVTNMYLADTTDSSTRSRYFSLLLGFSSTGVAVGPLLAGLIIRSTGTIMSAFYLALILHGIYLTLILFLLPESLTRARVRGVRLRRKQEMANQVSSNRVLGILKSSTKFLSPLLVLLPEQPSDVDLLKCSSRDWSLFFIVIAYGLVSSDVGSVPYRFQYVAARFHWTPEITNYFLSSVGFSRALVLAVILPPVIKYLKAASVQLPCVPNEAQDDDVESGKQLPASRPPVFDLALARACLVLDALTCLIVAITNTGTIYTLMGIISSLAAGFFPAIQALAIDVYTNPRLENRNEIGKLFGALSVTQVLASQIISPAVYGFVYSNTVAIFPQTILVVSLCALLLALASLSFVRIPPGSTGDRVIPEDGNEENQHMQTPENLDALEDEVVEGR